ncbi:MAG: thiol-disulfide oxidoreductase DCC family protein [Actinopolymorphaceae bacterium]
MTGKDQGSEGGPVFLFDGDCGFCTRCARLIERWIPSTADVTPWQRVDLAGLGVLRTRAEREVVWVAPDGRIDGGAQAIARLLLDAGGVWVVPGAVLRIPPFRWLAHLVYRVIAANRYRLPGGTPACALPARKPAE